MSGATRTVLLVTGDEHLAVPVWRELTTALATRADVYLTTHAYPARQLSRLGRRVVVIQLRADACWVRESVARPGGGWTDQSGLECAPPDVVRLALGLMAADRPSA
ncbi:hypothetical protein [Streptomyces aidingensis]|uniref:hypothetical protein n=1 Tax=Streptomyces aidingensis TaxID=910347 RepID=UPI0011149CFC|nr:hypothetical protein [Streptomyces aidingensis]